MLALSNLRESDKKIIVRVNALDEGGAEEIELLNSFKPDAIRVPKIKTQADVLRALSLCDSEIELHLSTSFTPSSHGTRNGGIPFCSS